MPTGLRDKYQVKKTGSDEGVEDAFVLRVQSDPAAWLAAWYYASMTYNMDLAGDMRQWLLDHAPNAKSLGDEGKLNEHLLSNVEDMMNAPNALPAE